MYSRILNSVPRILKPFPFILHTVILRFAKAASAASIYFINVCLLISKYEANLLYVVHSKLNKRIQIAFTISSWDRDFADSSRPRILCLESISAITR